MSKIEIYYFSGTGNSLYVVKELSKSLPDVQLIPIARFADEPVIKSNAEIVGFIFPIHMTAAPVVVENFIKKIDLSLVKYIFAIATRIGTSHNAFNDIDNILKKNNKILDAAFTLNMPSNDVKFKSKSPTTEEINKLELVINNDLLNIIKIISSKEKNRKPDISCITRIPFVSLLSRLAKAFDSLQLKFYADEKCTGCGVCEKVCLSKKIKMENGRPIWLKDVRCFKCYACLNYCPKQAVQIKGYTEGKDRYSHPYATADEIAAQK